MGPKRASASGGEKKKRMIKMKTKLEIITKRENGMRAIAIAREYSRNLSAIAMLSLHICTVNFCSCFIRTVQLFSGGLQQNYHYL